jgi:hypothetical protein
MLMDHLIGGTGQRKDSRQTFKAQSAIEEKKGYSNEFARGESMKCERRGRLFFTINGG